MDGPSGSARPSTSDPPRFTTLPLDRRQFLILMASAAAYAALRPQLAWARRNGRTPSQLQPWTLPDEPPSAAIDLTKVLIGAAVLAPSHWNSQPWRFEVEGNSIRLIADPQRALPVNDPDQRGMMISLGAALENLLIAARAYGLQPTVSYFPEQSRPGQVATVTWMNGGQRRDRGLFGAIPDRRTNRRGYDGRALFMQSRAQMTAQIPEELRLHWMDDREDMRGVADLVHDATHMLVSDRRSQAERFAWMRFDHDELKSGDGVPLDAFEIGGPAAWFASHFFNPNSHWLGWGADSAAHQIRDSIHSSGALALLTAPQPSAAAWLTGGQAYERFALKATQLGVAQHPLHAPIELERFRPDLLRRFGAGGEDPLLLVRLGHADRPDPTPRRAVALVSSFRTS